MADQHRRAVTTKPMAPMSSQWLQRVPSPQSDQLLPKLRAAASGFRLSAFGFLRLAFGCRLSVSGFGFGFRVFGFGSKPQQLTRADYYLGVFFQGYGCDGGSSALALSAKGRRVGLRKKAL